MAERRAANYSHGEQKAKKQAKFWIAPNSKGRWKLPWHDFPSETYPDKPFCATDFLPLPLHSRNFHILRNIHSLTPDNPRWEDRFAKEEWNWSYKDGSYLHKRHVVPIKSLVHSTHRKEASQILQQSGCAVFKGRPFSADGYSCILDERHYDGRAATALGDEFGGDENNCPLTSLGPLIWFGVTTRDSDGEQHEMETTIRKNIEKHHVDGHKLRENPEWLNRFATSPLFSGVSYYGNFAFTIPVNSFMAACDRCWERSAKEPPVKQARVTGQRPSSCFHVGGTLFYQKEVAYVVIVTAEKACAEMSQRGFPCLGKNKTLAIAAPDTMYTDGDRDSKDSCTDDFAYAHDEDEGAVIDSRPPDQQEPLELNDAGQRSPSKVYVRSSTSTVDFSTKDSPNFWSVYWEHVVFAVCADGLEFEASEITPHLTDHNVSVCQPSLKLKDHERFASYSKDDVRKSCHLGGYARKEDLLDALRNPRAEIMGKFIPK